MPGLGQRVIFAFGLGKRREQIDQLAERPRVGVERLPRRFAQPDGLCEIERDEFQKPVGLPAIQPDNGRNVLLLLGAEIADRAGDLAEDVARVEHQHIVAPGCIPLLRPVEEPKLARHGAGVEEVATEIDHHIDRPGLDELLPHRRLVPPGARRLRGHHDARAAVLVQVAVEIGQPKVIGVGDALRLVHPRQPEGQALVALHLLRIDLVHVEGRIGHDEVALAGQLVRVLVISDGFVPARMVPCRPCTARLIWASLAVVSFFSWP